MSRVVSVLHGLQTGWSDAESFEFGVAAAPLKHSIAGDFNLASETQVQAARTGALDGRR